MGLGTAVGALAATALIVFAARARPQEHVEVAKGAAGERRVLLLATSVTPEATQQDRPARLRRRRCSPVDPGAERSARALALGRGRRPGGGQRRLAHSAGALVAAGLPVSGSLGDPDPAQALEDELRDYAADEVILLAEGDDDPLAALRGRLGLPLTRV